MAGAEGTRESTEGIQVREAKGPGYGGPHSGGKALKSLP